MSTVAFKIRRKSDGLFAVGGYYGGAFHRHGKAWSTEAALRAHLTLVSRRYGSTREAEIKRVYEGCEVVRLEHVVAQAEDVIAFDARRAPKRGRR